MQTITKQPDNMGGVLRIWAVPPTDFTVAGTVLTITNDSNVVQMLLKEDSTSFTEDMTRTPAGKVYKTELSAIVPCVHRDSDIIIADMERRCKYVLVFEDGNGAYRLAGTRAVPLRFAAKAATQAQAAGLAAYAVSFAGLQTKRAVFIDNPF
jgi:hypothetical protein